MLQEYNQHLTNQFFELFNFTGTKYVDNEKMLDYSSSRSWTQSEEKIGRIFVRK